MVGHFKMDHSKLADTSMDQQVVEEIEKRLEKCFERVERLEQHMDRMNEDVKGIKEHHEDLARRLELLEKSRKGFREVKETQTILERHVPGETSKCCDKDKNDDPIHLCSETGK